MSKLLASYDSKVLFQLLVLRNKPRKTSGVNTIVLSCSWILWVRNLEKVQERWLVSAL